MKSIEKVAVVKCSSYKQSEVDSAIINSLNLINFKFKKDMKVLIKPNVVGNFPKKQIACTTNPALVETVCKILKKSKCEIFVGDSPFTNAESSFTASGIDKVAKKYGKLIIFEQDKTANIHDENAKILKNFKVSKTLKEADLIINMPKLKTHVLTKFTGAVKNLYGTILGGMKQRIHLKAKGDKNFSKILIDIYQNVKPELTIMDAVIGMDGEGPTSGNPQKVGLILASKNGIALDIAATKMIGLNPKKVYYLRESIKRKIYPDYNFENVGMKLPQLNFEIPGVKEKSNALKNLGKLFMEKPITLYETKCVKCGTCAKHCPTKSIKLSPFPTINRKTCIRCFCCIEICPHDAMKLGK